MKKTMTTHSPRPFHPQQQRGMTLLETLIAIVVMALAILGVLAMQMRVLAETQSTTRRAQAIRLIENLAEQVRLNPGSSNTSVAEAYTKASPEDKGCVVTTTTGTPCSAVDLAETAVARWKQSVIQTLPGGIADVHFVSDDGTSAKRQLAVRVGWRNGEQKTGDAAKDQELRKAFADAVKFNDAGNRQVACPSANTCHLQFIPLTTRCLPDTSVGVIPINRCVDGLYQLPAQLAQNSGNTP